MNRINGVRADALRVQSGIRIIEISLALNAEGQPIANGLLSNQLLMYLLGVMAPQRHQRWPDLSLTLV